MGRHSERFKAFVKLGALFREYTGMEVQADNHQEPGDVWLKQLTDKAALAGMQNAWFTPENIREALKSWGVQLREENLSRWLSRYDLNKNRMKSVAIVMAGNIPLVGFHDFLSVLITGNTAQVKCSSSDRVLLPFVAEYLMHCEPAMADAITFTENRLESFEAVIATGSNNTSRYFKYYFGRKPNIIRKNRNSAAILDGSESQRDLVALGKDIFTYFGLGCRNVSKLFVPRGYNFERFFHSMDAYAMVAHHQKYANNYDYNKAVYLMSGFTFLDNGFLLLKEDTGYSSPIGVLFYEYYEDMEALKKRLGGDSEMIQCLLGKDQSRGWLPFGMAQEPDLWDYADGIDTVEFLLRT